MSLTNIKISTRLRWAFGVVILGFVGMAGYAWYAVNSLSDEWTDFNTHILVRIRITNEMTRQSGVTVHMLRDYILRGEDYDQKFVASVDAMDNLVAQYRQRGGSAGEAVYLDKMSAAGATLRTAMRRLQELRANGIVDPRELDRAALGMDELYATPINQLRDVDRGTMGRQGVRITDLAQTNQVVMFVVAIPIILLTLATGLLLSRAITGPLRQALGVALRVAAGDLTSKIETQRRDEIGELLAALGTMSDSLKRIVGDVRGGAEQVAAACKEIAQGNSELSMRTEEQASSLEETAASHGRVDRDGQAECRQRQARPTSSRGDASAVARKGGAVVERKW